MRDTRRTCLRRRKYKLRGSGGRWGGGGREGWVNARMRYRKKRNGGEDGRRYDGNKRSFAWCDHGSLSGLPPRETLDSVGSLTTFGNDMAGPRVSGSSVALQKHLPPSVVSINRPTSFSPRNGVRRIRRGQEQTFGRFVLESFVPLERNIATPLRWARLVFEVKYV